MERFEELSEVLQKHHQAISQIFHDYDDGKISFAQALENLGKVQSQMIEDLKARRVKNYGLPA